MHQPATLRAGDEGHQRPRYPPALRCARSLCSFNVKPLGIGRCPDRPFPLPRTRSSPGRKPIRADGAGVDRSSPARHPGRPVSGHRFGEGQQRCIYRPADGELASWCSSAHAGDERGPEPRRLFEPGATPARVKPHGTEELQGEIHRPSLSSVRLSNSPRLVAPALFTRMSIVPNRSARNRRDVAGLSARHAQV